MTHGPPAPPSIAPQVGRSPKWNPSADMLGDLTRRPLVCVTLAFAGGVAAAAAPHLAWALGVVAAVALIWAAATGRRAFAGVSILVLAACAGILLARASQRPGLADVSRLPHGGQTLVGTVADAPSYSGGVWSFVLDAEQHLAGATAEPVVGRCYVRMVNPAVVRRGDRWLLTGRLRELTGPRNPGGRSELQRFSALGVTSALSVGGPELAERLGKGQLGWIPRHAYAAQSRCLALLDHFVQGPYRELTAQVAASVIFGVHASPPSPEVSDAFRRAGTIHLLVVSGAMVSSVFGLVFLPGVLGATWRRALLERQSGWPVSGRGRIAHRPGLWAAVIAVLAATYYAVLTEGGQAVARAAIMGLLIGLAFVLRRLPRVASQHGLVVDHYTLLALAALAILTAWPAALFQPGFQLSFAAVWAIIYLTPKLQPASGWLPKWLALTIGGTVAAQLATFPILAWHYGNIPVAGFPANLLAIPLAGVVLVAGMLTCALGVALPWLAPLAGWVTGWSTRGMVRVSTAFASLPWAAPEIRRPHPLLVIAWYAALILAGWRLSRGFAGRRPAPLTRE